MTPTVQPYRFGRVDVMPAQRRLLVDGRSAPLGARAFDLLLALIERRDRVVSGVELIELVWPGLVVEENNLRQQVAALRKVLGADAVVTVPGRGYRFTLSPDGQADPQPYAGTAASHADVSHNLPLNLPTLIGRERELTTVTDLLARSVWWRGSAVRLPRVNRAKRSLSRSATCSTRIALTRAAASSKANGMPSS